MKVVYAGSSKASWIIIIAARTHLALEKDSPEPRPIQAPDAGRIIAIPEVGGLHHRYERRAA